MNDIKLSLRLQKIADFVENGSRLADIGSDHAYLPTYLVQRGIINFAVAGEVVKGPFEIAKSHIKEKYLHNKIDVRLANGLSVIKTEDQIDTVVIAGMGGILISEILNEGSQKLEKVTRLILQPNNHEATVREWLVSHHFKIVDEEILIETQKFYEIIIAESIDENYPSLTELSVKELIFGPKLSVEQSDIFRKKWQKELNTLNKILDRLPEERKEKRKELIEQKMRIQEVLE